MQQEIKEKGTVFGVISALALFGIGVYVYLIAGQLRGSAGRIDMTRNDVYTISEVTEKTLRELKDIVTVRVFFSQDVESLKDIRQRLKDKLRDMEAASGGNLQLVFPDMRIASEQKKAQSLGIREVEAQSFKAGEVTIKQCYQGLAVLYGGKYDTIPILAEDVLAGLEYRLVTMIKKLARENVTEVAIAVAEQSQSNPMNPMQPQAWRRTYAGLYETLSQQYKVEWIDLTEPNPVIDARFTSAVIIAPDTISEEALRAINAYVQAGRRAVIFTSGIQMFPAMGQLAAFSQRPEINKLLETWGLEVEIGAVRDYASCSVFSFGGPFGVIYPYGVKIVGGNFSEDNPAVGGARQAVLLWPAALKHTPAEGLTATVLMRTTEAAELIKDDLKVGPMELAQHMQKDRPFENKENLARHALAYELKGHFPDYENPAKKSEAAGIVAVIGTTFVINDDIRTQGGNAFLPRDTMNVVTNLVDYLSLGKDLIEIRMKAPVFTTARKLGPAATLGYQLAGLAFVPLLVIVYGIVRYARRAARRRKLAEI